MAQQADLRGANFIGANFDGADFAGAYLTGAINPPGSGLGSGVQKAIRH
jgi:uncharacterized protein YjbI with pentapeptide repeats